MTQMESTKRKMQKRNDYQRHKLFRKIKRRRKAQAEADQQIAVKQLRKKLKLPKFDRGEDDGNYLYKSDIHINKDASITDVSTGKRYDGARIPEVVVTARKIPTFKDIEKQIGRKITQDEIDKIVAVDPEIPIELPNVPKEKGAYSPSVTNEFINTVVGTAGDATNYLANKAGLSNLAPNEQLVETRDGDALLDLPGYGQAAKLSLYGLGRYGGKLGLKKLQKLAKQKLLEREFALSNADNQRALQAGYPNEALFHTLMHDAGKLWAGDGLGRYGVSIVEQIFPDATDEQSDYKWKPSAKDSKDWEEYRATMNQVRHRLLDTEHLINGKYPSGKELEKAIDNRQMDSIMANFDVANGYGADYYNAYKDLLGKAKQTNSYRDWQNVIDFENHIRNSLKYLPAVTPFAIGVKPNDYNSGKDIHIKPSKRGTFTKAAKQHGMSVQGFANKVLRKPSKYSAAMRKKANFAHNAASWKH